MVSKPKSAKAKNSDEVIEEYDSIIKAKKITLLLPFLKEKSKGNIEALKKAHQKMQTLLDDVYRFDQRSGLCKKRQTRLRLGPTRRYGTK
ncbi:hypothetical protein AAFH68_27360 [Flavobacterium sp. CGRL1]